MDPGRGAYAYKSIWRVTAAQDTALPEDSDKENHNIRFNKWKKVHSAKALNFSEYVLNLMERNGWDTSIFEEKTGLGREIFSRIRRKQSGRLKLESVIAICIGLDVDVWIAMDLLQLSGYTLTDSDEDKAYRYALSEMRGDTIEDRHKFLAAQGINSFIKKGKLI